MLIYLKIFIFENIFPRPRGNKCKRFGSDLLVIEISDEWRQYFNYEKKCAPY